MFTIASLNLNSKSVTIGDVTGSTKLLVPGRATAATNIPQGATTIPINPKLLYGRSEVVQILVGTNEFGTIELDKQSRNHWPKKLHWVRALRLSDDCHSYNVQLKLQSANKKANSKLILQAVKPIALGEELLLWFSEEILAMIQMVFLTPANIQGQKKYVCTTCCTLYESPNPLKLHIILNCGRLSISDFWDRLANLLLENGFKGSNYEQNEFSFKLSPIKQHIAMDLSLADIKRPFSQPSTYYTSSPNNEETQKIFRPYSEPPVTHNSAFKPFRKIESDSDLAKSPELPLRYGSPQAWPDLSYYNQNQFFTNLHANDEAHIESLVSSLGKSKEGHICLYCGKCYSRKYGLKIHIRTHTGYKPLKCKFCSRPFGDPSNLNKHVRLHAEGETPYKCELCGKILVRRRDLERHLKSRHMSEIHPGQNILAGGEETYEEEDENDQK